MMLASGTYHGFAACYSRVVTSDNGELLVEPKVLDMLNVGPGDRVLAVAR